MDANDRQGGPFLEQPEDAALQIQPQQEEAKNEVEVEDRDGGMANEQQDEGQARGQVINQAGEDQFDDMLEAIEQEIMGMAADEA